MRLAFIIVTYFKKGYCNPIYMNEISSTMIERKSLNKFWDNELERAIPITGKNMNNNLSDTLLES